MLILNLHFISSFFIMLMSWRHTLELTPSLSSRHTCYMIISYFTNIWITSFWWLDECRLCVLVEQFEWRRRPSIYRSYEIWPFEPFSAFKRYYRSTQRYYRLGVAIGSNIAFLHLLSGTSALDTGEVPLKTGCEAVPKRYPSGTWVGTSAWYLAASVESSRDSSGQVPVRYRSKPAVKRYSSGTLAGTSAWNLAASIPSSSGTSAGQRGTTALDLTVYLAFASFLGIDPKPSYFIYLLQIINTH